MDKRVKYGIFGALALVFFCIVLVFYLPDSFEGEKTKASKLENWSRSIKGQEDRIVTLPEKLFRRDGEIKPYISKLMVSSHDDGGEQAIAKLLEVTPAKEWEGVSVI